MSQPIEFKEHVWMGNDCEVLKGTDVESGCIVEARSVITNNTEPDKNCILIGTPARNDKRDIERKHEREEI